MRFLRYPGGKSKLLNILQKRLPQNDKIIGNYIEPFVGGGSVYLSIKPYKAILSDLNVELIELYKGIRNYPHKIWETFCSFPIGKRAYYKIRNSDYLSKPLYYRAARILYLNRTCFKGMWRHSPKGIFSVGYGGEERRWVITHKNIIELSNLFKRARLKISDFEEILDEVENDDYIFLDPPYKPGEKELVESHYTYSKFTFEDQIRLAKKIKVISRKKNVKWLMTNSAHREIKKIYKDFIITKIPIGTSERIGIYTKHSKEILISNY